MTRWFVLLLIPFCTQAAELPESWRNWQYFRPMQGPDAPSSWLRAALPPDIYGPAQAGLADLRIIDRSGKEVPYLLHAQQDQCDCTWRVAPVGDTGFVPGKYSQAIVDTGSGGAPHNAVQLTLDQKDFFAWTEISASDDRLDWRIVRSKAPLFRFEQDKLTDGQTLSYPSTRSRWLRLRFLQGDRALQVNASQISEHRQTAARRVPLPATLSPANGQTDGESRWEADMEQRQAPVSAVRFATGQAEFHRQVIVSASDDGKRWRNAGQGHIHRHANEGKPDAELEVVFPERRARFWRIALLNRNDSALPGVQPELLGIPRQVAFKREAGEEYRVLYGNPRTRAPHYELVRLSRPEQWQAAPAAVLGVAQGNLAYVSPEAWSERHPGLLWAALLIAVGGLAWMAIKALRPGKAEAQENRK